VRFSFCSVRTLPLGTLPLVWGLDDPGRRYGKNNLIKSYVNGNVPIPGLGVRAVPVPPQLTTAPMRRMVHLKKEALATTQDHLEFLRFRNDMEANSLNRRESTTIKHKCYIITVSIPT
jgi:hypothetical protein